MYIQDQILRLIGHQNWLSWNIRYRLLAYLSKQGNFDVHFFNGTHYKGTLDSFIDRRVFFFGAHEREYLLAMKRYIKPGYVVLDVGANVGHHSLFFAAFGATVFSFEPYPPLQKIIEERARENSVNISSFACGLSDSTGTLPFFAATGSNFGVGSFDKGNDPGNRYFADLPITTGDLFVEDKKIKKVDFIKIDSEGFEEKVLRGLQKTIKRDSPVIEIEFLRKNFSSREEFERLTEGYKKYAIKINRRKLFFFNDPKPYLSDFSFETGRTELLLIPETSI